MIFPLQQAVIYTLLVSAGPRAVHGVWQYVPAMPPIPCVLDDGVLAALACRRIGTGRYWGGSSAGNKVVEVIAQQHNDAMRARDEFTPP